MAGAQSISSVNLKPLPIPSSTPWTTLGLFIYFGCFIVTILQLNQQLTQPDQAWYGPWVIATLLMLTFPLLIIQIFPPAFTWTFVSVFGASCLTAVSLIILVSNKMTKDIDKEKEKKSTSTDLVYTRLYTGIVIGIFAIITGKNTVGQCYGQINRWLPSTYLNYPSLASILCVFALAGMVTLYLW